MKLPFPTSVPKSFLFYYLAFIYKFWAILCFVYLFIIFIKYFFFLWSFAGYIFHFYPSACPYLHSSFVFTSGTKYWFLGILLSLLFSRLQICLHNPAGLCYIYLMIYCWIMVIFCWAFIICSYRGLTDTLQQV